jgi:hypothetical protein
MQNSRLTGGERPFLSAFGIPYRSPLSKGCGLPTPLAFVIG